MLVLTPIGPCFIVEVDGACNKQQYSVFFFSIKLKNINKLLIDSYFVYEYIKKKNIFFKLPKNKVQGFALIWSSKRTTKKKREGKFIITIDLRPFGLYGAKKSFRLSLR